MEAGDEAQRSTGRLVVIGNFDGVHRGHQAVLSGAVGEAKTRGLVPTVLTFDPHPAAVLGRSPPPPLTSLPRKLSLLRRIDPQLRVVVHPFTKDLAASSPEQFVRSVLLDELGARLVVVGENFRFGKDRAGDLDALRRLGRLLGFSARAEPLKGDETGPYSSTRVRQALAQGDVPLANHLLGRPHRIVGTVVRGDQRGRSLGFPTANLDGIAELLPAQGVYTARAIELSSKEEEVKALGLAVVNVGARPTVERPDAVEAHVLDFDGNLYEKNLALDFGLRLREVRRFGSVDELSAQITRDIQNARRASERADLTGAEANGQDVMPGAPDRESGSLI